MPDFSRRTFLQHAAGAAALACAGGPVLAAKAAKQAPRGRRLPHGYLLVQDVATYNASRFGAISTRDEAEQLFGAIEGKLDAVEYATLYYDRHDMRAHATVAEVGVRRKIDLWASTFRMLSRIRSLGKWPAEFQASIMEPDGTIHPATVDAADSKSPPLFDVLNPQAVDWFIERISEVYLRPMKGLLAGVFFNEDCLHYAGKAVNHRRYDYWRNPTFSPAVLALWQDYCRRHGVTHAGKPVDRFPVHEPAMVSRGEDRTACYPGWNVPAEVQPGQRFAELPKSEGVWRHWYAFVGGQFLSNWVGRIATAANEINGGESGWKGTMYFGLHHWSLPYEQVRDRDFAVPKAHRWGAWGLQRGVDLEALAANPAMDAIICETYPPIAANLEGYVAEYARIARAAGKTFGVMLHRDDKWGLKAEEEERRWALIDKYQPTILTRYPRVRMLPGDPFYNASAEEAFARAWAKYKRAGAKTG